MRKINVAAAQMGSIPSSITGNIDAKKINNLLINGTSEQKKEAKEKLFSLDIDGIRKYNFERISEILKTAASRDVELTVFPELALTSFFPYFWIDDEKFLTNFCENNNIWKEKFYNKAKELKVAVAFGYCQREKLNYNIFDLFNPNDGSDYIYRKVHIPGFDKPRRGEETFQFEKKYS